MFSIRAQHPITHEEAVFTYDPHTSALLRDGLSVVATTPKPYREAKRVSPDTPRGKVSALRRIKVQLGMTCNYECEYCNQRFVPRPENTSFDDVAEFIANIGTWYDGGEDGLGKGTKIEYWGGEPFVYWKKLRPMHQLMRSLYPHARYSVITNGSLLDMEKARWLVDGGFSLAISHDGPGQHVRGEDPFDNPECREAVLWLYNRLKDEGRISFNSIMSSGNRSQVDIIAYFVALTGDINVPIGEGGTVTPYDEGGELHVMEGAEAQEFRRDSWHNLRMGAAHNFKGTRVAMDELIKSVTTLRPSSALEQKCGMDRETDIAVDLNGRVLTCQNVSATSAGLMGSHHIGNVSDLGAVKLNTSKHWSFRDGCKACPVLQTCKGACMFLDGPLFEKACMSAYSEHITYFALAFEVMTGFVPMTIEGGGLPAERGDLWGLHATAKKAKRVIPILEAK